MKLSLLPPRGKQFAHLIQSVFRPQAEAIASPTERDPIDGIDLWTGSVRWIIVTTQCKEQVKRL